MYPPNLDSLIFKSVRKREFLNSDTFCITLKTSLENPQIMCSLLKGKDMLSGHVFGARQCFICNVYFHASWPPT